MLIFSMRATSSILPSPTFSSLWYDTKPYHSTVGSTYYQPFIKRTQSAQETIFVAITILSTRSDSHILQKQANKQTNKLHDDKNLSTLYSAHLCCHVCHDGTEPDKPPFLAHQGVVVVDRHHDKAACHNDQTTFNPLRHLAHGEHLYFLSWTWRLFWNKP